MINWKWSWNWQKNGDEFLTKEASENACHILQNSHTRSTTAEWDTGAASMVVSAENDEFCC
jgi:hypothetical protein